MKKIIFLLLIFFHAVLQANFNDIENLYILIEPTSTVDIDCKSKGCNPIVKNSFDVAEQIVKWVSAKKNKPKFKNLIINGKIFQRKKIKYAKLKRLLKTKFKKDLIENDKNIIGLLGNLHNEFIQNNWENSKNLLIIIGDISNIKLKSSTHGVYFNSAFLKNKNSPFVKKFLNEDNKALKNTSVIVITRTQLATKYEKKRKDFIVNLFNFADMNTYYVGNSLMNIRPSKNKNIFITDLINNVKIGKQKKLKIVKLKDIQRCQIIDGNDGKAVPISNCGGNLF